MRPTLWGEVKRVATQVVDVPRGEREGRIRALAADPSVCTEVLRLLAGRDRVAEATARVATLRAAAADGAAPPAPRDVGPGSVVARRYELGPRLGVGAFGSVHRARDRATGEQVAVKLVALAGDAEAHALRREVAVLRRSRLPGVVELLDEGSEGGNAYIVMRLVEGTPFPGPTSTDPPSWAELGPRALALVEALGRLHWLGVLHRDVKPENVVVGADGSVTIVDLGVAQDSSGAADAAADCIVGTPYYLAPERFVGDPATAASDLYSVGMMLWETLAGRPSRECTTIQELIGRCREAPPPLREFAPAVPAHVAEAVDALLHPEPSRRPASARVAAAMLRGEGEAGARVRLPPALRDAPASESGLRVLFAGHDRLFHVKEDGARELWRRTLGRPEEVAREIETWIDSGIARWEDRRIVIDRAGLERVESRVWSMLPHAPSPDGLSRLERDVAAVLEVAGCAVPLAAVSQALACTAPDAEAAVARLEEQGLARRGPDGAVEATRSIDAAASWTTVRRRGAHAAIAAALPAASERRLFHLIAADAVDQVPSEALAVGRRLHRDGRIDAAMFAASGGLAAARAASSDAGVADSLLLLLVDSALAASSVGALDLAAVELARVPHDTPTGRTLSRVCTGGRLVLLGSPERGLAETASVEEGAPDEAARLRSVVRSYAAGLVADAELGHRVLAESFAWARRSERRGCVGAAREWLGWRRYRQGRFASAAWLHVRCAAATRTVRSRVTALTNAASAYLEVGDLARAAEHAAHASRLAAEHRLPTHEARATWVLRSAQYRGGDIPEPDPELVAALQEGVAPVIAAVGLLVEAAILFRRGRRDESSGVARAAASVARRANHAAAESLALGLAATCGGGLDGESLERFLGQLGRVHLPPLRSQALALWLMSGDAAAARVPADVLAGVRLRPREQRDPHPHEVLSEVEWSEALEGVPGVPGTGPAAGLRAARP